MARLLNNKTNLFSICYIRLDTKKFYSSIKIDFITLVELKKNLAPFIQKNIIKADNLEVHSYLYCLLFMYNNAIYNIFSYTTIFISAQKNPTKNL